MKDTKIEWADDTVNPWWGCERVSPACAHCYAETLAARFHPGLWGPGSERRLRLDRAIGELESIARRGEREGRLRRVFIASMSDVFEDRADLIEPRKRLWEALHRLDGRLTPMLLTKRPAVMATWAKEHGWPAGAWAGTTVEDQRRADERIQHLLQVPALHFLSMEPLLEPVDLAKVRIGSIGPVLRAGTWDAHKSAEYDGVGGTARVLDGIVTPDGASETGWLGGMSFIDWVIVGGESGPKARPMHPRWINDLRDQTVAAGVPFFVKQIGEWAWQGPHNADVILRKNGIVLAPNQRWIATPGEAGRTLVTRIGKKVAGRLLDGRTWDEVPTP